ncbi:MAG: hypothetical protein C4336_09090 [Armatimonadota bacterium]
MWERSTVAESSVTRPYEFVKRCLDVACALLGIALTLPLWGGIALAIRLDSPGSVFFAHERIGRYGRRFKVLKFRTMIQEAPQQGASVTAVGDPRITRVGRFLRKTKLDELPQLWNVLKGEMSLVGPRPEVEKYIQLYPETACNLILSVPPGITGLTQIRYRHEERLLAEQANPEQYYREVLLPQKIASDVEYVLKRGLWIDVEILFRTLVVLFR